MQTADIWCGDSPYPHFYLKFLGECATLIRKEVTAFSNLSLLESSRSSNIPWFLLGLGLSEENQSSKLKWRATWGIRWLFPSIGASWDPLRPLGTP